MSDSEIKLFYAQSSEVKNRILAPDEHLSAIDTGAYYVAGPDGKPQAVLTASTSAQGVETEPARGLLKAGDKTLMFDACPSLSDVKTVILYGDSGVQHGNYWIDIGSKDPINDGSGTCVVTMSHQFFTGMRAWIVNSNDKYWSGEKIITRIDGGSFSFALDPRAAPRLQDTLFWRGSISRLILVTEYVNCRASVFHALNAKLGAPWKMLANMSANGQQAKHMLEKVDDEIINYPTKPDAVWIQCGANDYRIGLDSAEVAAEWAQKLIMRINNAGIAVMYQPWQPDDARDPSDVTLRPGLAAIRFDRIMRKWCDHQPHVYYFPRQEVMTDPTSALGYAYANILGADGTHDTGVSGDMCANAAYSQYNSIIPKHIRRLPSLIADSHGVDAASRNMFANGLFSNTTGGSVSGGAGSVPFRVAILKTGGITYADPAGGSNFWAPRTVANDGDTCGNNMVARVTTTAAGEEAQFDIVGVNTGLAAKGGYIQAAAHVKLKLVSGTRPKLFALYYRPIADIGVTYNINGLGDSFYPSTLPLPNDLDEVIICPPYAINSSFGSHTMRLWIVASGAAVFDVEIGRPMFEWLPSYP